MHILRNFELSCNQLDFLYLAMMEREKSKNEQWKMLLKNTSFIFIACVRLMINLLRTNYNGAYEYTFISHKNHKPNFSFLVKLSHSEK